MIKLYESELPHFAQGVINGWHEGRTKEPLFYQAKTTPGQRRAYVAGWRIGKAHHHRPYINNACLQGQEQVEAMILTHFDETVKVEG